MRIHRVTALGFTVLVCLSAGFNERRGSFADLSAAENISPMQSVPLSQQGSPVRVPETVSSQPGSWPQPNTRRTVDVNELKNRANELVALSNALPSQMDQIGNGKLPKELMDNLKKIEKLAKHLRSEIE